MSEELNVTFIKQVQTICGFWDPAADSAAVDFVRKIDSEDAKDLEIQARLAVAKSDAVHHAEKEIVDRFHAYCSAKEGE